jgi:alcohol dehydrogenase YqhD (iron-dependent ADH family)
MKLKLPTTFYFGSECVKNNLSNELTINNIKNVLLVAGSGSIKKNGLYKLIVNECIKAKVKLHEH